jgi:transketolase
MMEGVASEAASIAGHLGLENLIVVYDDNHITIDGPTDLTFSEDVAKRFEAYGWFSQRVDGHNPAEVRAALDQAVAEKNRPSLIVARTHIAIGAPTKQDTADAHGSPLGAAEAEATKKAAGWPLEAFHAPDGARSLFKQRAEENRPVYEAWRKRIAQLPAERVALYEQFVSRPVPNDLFEQLLAAAVDLKADATRTSAGKIEQRAAALMPSLVGGAADLAGSTKVTIKDGGDVRRGDYSGRNIHFGVREHAMAAIVNGLALSGFFIPFGSTFLIFSDYMRPSLRLAALMDLQVLHIFSHDSIFLGEDGPTHQSVEQLWTLRLIPNLDVVRPADPLECAAAWTHALLRRQGPTVLALTRQKVPVLERPADFNPRQMLNGAYILADADNPEFVLIATGSEVHVAVEAKRILERSNRRVRVVSAPCWQAFERLSQAKREAVLGKDIRIVTIEAGRTDPWRAVSAPSGLSIGVDRFGASAPWERLAEEFDLTGQKIAAAILRHFG